MPDIDMDFGDTRRGEVVSMLEWPSTSASFTMSWLARRVAVLRRSAVPFHRLLDTLGQAGAELQAAPQFCLRRAKPSSMRR